MSLVCPRCGLDHGLDERFCTACGMPLVHPGEREEPARDEAHANARKVRPQYAQGTPVKVAWARNQAEAELIQGLLLEEGIPSVVRRQRGFDVPDMLAAGPRDVMVPEAGADAARTLLRDADALPAELDPLAEQDTGSVSSVTSPLRLALWIGLIGAVGFVLLAIAVAAR